ncbi:MAG TPA: malto-oligosyltrehalose synthase [Streptosporangiaceae bacterium]|nr:malto-oligosyltrehalose synthase [Streptosporangiaceae bacterium]
MTGQPRPQAMTPPLATYRVQFGAGFTFDDAAAISTYLAALGVSHVYCSPILQAASTTSAGYDIVDYSKLDERLGGTAGYERLTAALGQAGLGQVLDIVPNHMAMAGQRNAWWWDVLENGPASRYASYFDIDWDPPERKLTGHVLMPVLGDRYGRVLEAGELKARRRGGSFTVAYHDLALPLSPRTLDELLASAADRAGSAELKAIASDLGNLPHAILTDADAVQERHRGNEELRARLVALLDQDVAMASAIDAEIEALNRDPDLLDALLGRQNYRLAYWGTAAEELSYRRFFDIDQLAGLRVERPEVFDDVHRLVLRLVAEGSVGGLRVDHVDGLADPEGYLTRLRELTGEAAYLVVEKILGPDEKLPGTWPVAGTTGYDFLNLAGELFVDPAGRQAILAGYATFTGSTPDLAEITRAAKLQIMTDDLATEVERLTAELDDICERYRRQRDYTRRELRESLREVLAAFAVYRCYPRPGHDVTLADRAKVAAAVTAARGRRPDLDAELFDFIGRLLVMRYEGDAEARFAVRFAQVSAPVMAKGVEDTAFYRYQPLICLNEVGGDPARFGGSVDDFHDAMRYAALHWPDTMLALSTHDTKRSGDVRARISVLSELPLAWNAAVTIWSEHNAKHKKRSARHGRGGWPDRPAEHLLYQTLVGAWPISAERLAAFMVKAAREAKLQTSWTDPNTSYESALTEFVTALLADPGFVAAVEEFLGKHSIVTRGRLNSLAQVALLLTCPGVPDIYQGTEVWDNSLVDPDNRRPVDFASRGALLAELADAGPAETYAFDDAGGPKIWLIARLLAHRRAYPGVYDRSSGYEPLEILGAHADRFVGFTRTGGLAVIVPRLVTSTADPWTGTEVILPSGRWVSVLTGHQVEGGRLRAATLLRQFPVQVLARDV